MLQHRIVSLLLAIATFTCVAAAPSNVYVVETRKDTTNRLTPQAEMRFGADFQAPNVIELFPKQTFQKIFGFGGAFTEAAANTFASLPPQVAAASSGGLLGQGRHPLHCWTCSSQLL